MRSLVLQSLQQGFELAVAQDLISAHDKLLGEFRKGDVQAALNAAGLFAEHALRAIERVRTGHTPGEIKVSIRGCQGDRERRQAPRIIEGTRSAHSFGCIIRHPQQTWCRACKGDQSSLHRCRSGCTGRLLDTRGIRAPVSRSRRGGGRDGTCCTDGGKYSADREVWRRDGCDNAAPFGYRSPAHGFCLGAGWDRSQRTGPTRETITRSDHAGSPETCVCASHSQDSVWRISDHRPRRTGISRAARRRKWRIASSEASPS